MIGLVLAAPEAAALPTVELDAAGLAPAALGLAAALPEAAAGAAGALPDAAKLVLGAVLAACDGLAAALETGAVLAGADWLPQAASSAPAAIKPDQRLTMTFTQTSSKSSQWGVRAL